MVLRLLAGHPEGVASGLSRRPFLGDWEKAMSVPRFGGKSGILVTHGNEMQYLTEQDLMARCGLGQGVELHLSPEERLTPSAPGAGEQQEDTDSHRIR